MASSAFYELLTTRRSIRRYRPTAVSHDTVMRLLHAAIMAPSAHNRQPWRFAAIWDGHQKERLAQAMGERLRADRTKDGDPAVAIDKDVARSFERISAAPLVVVACLSMADMDHYPDAKRRDAERLMAVQSVAMACQNFLLAAHVEGLGSSWMCAPLFCPDVVAAALGLPEDWEPQALLTVGEPASAGKPPSRRPVETVLCVI
jgi:coenzyme F420-0:L-glutamate ligase / coenzyme F420-1:gamma-L-glutamate ligase